MCPVLIFTPELHLPLYFIFLSLELAAVNCMVSKSVNTRVSHFPNLMDLVWQCVTHFLGNLGEDSIAQKVIRENTILHRYSCESTELNLS